MVKNREQEEVLPGGRAQTAILYQYMVECSKMYQIFFAKLQMYSFVPKNYCFIVYNF